MLACFLLAYTKFIAISPEILKQVWDLSDQDNDSMLSLREFCIALYLMERYREGRPLPPVLPGYIFEETQLSASGQPGTAYANTNWRHSPGIHNLRLASSFIF